MFRIIMALENSRLPLEFVLIKDFGKVKENRVGMFQGSDAHKHRLHSLRLILEIGLRIC